MLDRAGFDGWASEYDRAVETSENAGTYPFCGYKDVHDRVYNLLRGKKRVLDLGIGTARLTQKLYDGGAKIYGVDFSENMLSVARSKMPDATLVLADLTEGFPKALDGERFDAATALYSIHHLTDAQKKTVIDAALSRMEGNGIFVIGDVAFATEKERDACKAVSPTFDTEEHYIVFETFSKMFPGRASFTRVSFCAGVVVVNA